MAVIKTGILGGFSGKVGTVIGAKWHDLDVIKAIPKKTSKKATQTQADQRIKFGLVTHFFSDLKDVIDLGYQSKNKSMSPMNAAVQHHLNNAVTGISPNFTLDYAKVMMTSGKLKSAENILGTAAAGRKIMVSWDFDPEDYKEAVRAERATDKALLVVYDETKKLFLNSARSAVRSSGKLEVIMPRMTVAGNSLHAYLYFTTKDDKIASTSAYLGPLKAVA
ncbi:DUF6266 family protein [Pedobacter cryoconitis]|uniref:Uncharacterized protein n=1 Tax=Pedobacter cryoconitis TaxID=188932 RepID=A0A7X0IZW4_9SPHI|nr:DUF6266 family protein [Pedobacter cryoconitis]MBB6498479.1 hypothetical protein [Pedobacter cryoconitis]